MYTYIFIYIYILDIIVAVTIKNNAAKMEKLHLEL